MSKLIQTSIPIPVLSTKSVSFGELNPFWASDRRYGEQAIQNFINRNEKIFEYLDVHADGFYDDYGKYELRLTTHKYVGCAPLFSPSSGKPFGNLIIEGRFGEDISELLSLLGDILPPEFNEKYRLCNAGKINPPLYFECQKFIDKYIEAKKQKWRKFTNIETIQPVPTSATRWDKYAMTSIYPENIFKYPNKRNVLSTNHSEWKSLTYVLDLCIQEINSIRTPLRSKLVYKGKIEFLSKSYDKFLLTPVKKIIKHAADPLVIKELKDIANNILEHVSSTPYAWRMDFAEFFERYVQYLMGRVARDKGAHISNNPKYHIGGYKPVWALNYIEPDIVIHKDDVQYVIDAKYKAHMFNTEVNSDELKDSFRADLHQVLAYSSFDINPNKHIMLVYPCKEIKIIKEVVNSSINNTSCDVIMIGVPLQITKVNKIIDEFKKILIF